MKVFCGANTSGSEMNHYITEKEKDIPVYRASNLKSQNLNNQFTTLRNQNSYAPYEHE